MPAPALPAWPLPTSPDDRRTGGAEPAAPPREARRLTGHPDGGPATRAGRAEGRASGRYDGGPDLGTIYGAGTEGPGFSTVSIPSNPMENSGSLTGHILAQGWTETPTEERSSTTKVVVVLAASLGLLVAISVLVVLLANDTVGGLVGGVLS
ncbi:hypothetical protein [Micromonospora sp. C31]|uniref:hypothetical protein n=1 Tax=Micromonospora sp. C31 TaxID=2824876 RepID=UPI001FFD81BA|nr:hypothetical protein [Micromonospora sp. C31]